MSKKAIVGSVKEVCGVGRLRVQDKTLSGRMKKEKSRLGRERSLYVHLLLVEGKLAAVRQYKRKRKEVKRKVREVTTIVESEKRKYLKKY